MHDEDMNMDELIEEFADENAVHNANKERARYEEVQEDVNLMVKDYPAVQRELDLHGMTVPEALREVDRYIDQCIRHRVRTIRIITGKGLHSVNFKPVLPGETEQHLAELRREGKVLSFKLEKNRGAFTVYLVS